MPRVDEVEIRGTVIGSLPNATFRVSLDTGQVVLATVSGKMRMHRIRVLEGDVVTVLMTPYDSSRGRIVHRFRGNEVVVEEPVPEADVPGVEPTEPS